MNATLFKMVSGYLLSLNGDIDDPYAIVNEQLADDYGWYKLSLKNCQSIERGYDLDELADENVSDIHEANTDFIFKDVYREYFKEGFQKAIELMGDKKFSEEDVRNIFAKTLENAPSTESHTRMISDEEYRHSIMDELYNRITKSLHQNEWDVEIEMEKVIDETKIIGAVKGVKGSGSKITTYKSVPKLDENGCLILKKI